MMLEKILKDSWEALEIRKKRLPLEELEKLALGRRNIKSLEGALREHPWAVIAEVKRASPSKGLLVSDWDAASLAQRYAALGASAISVVTDKRNFLGSLEDLKNIALALGDGGPPILRKDFIFDRYQVYEALAYGADAVLLIVAVLGERLGEFIRLSEDLGLSCLVEVHKRKELEIALKMGAAIIGINNRNLETFEVDLGTTFRLFPLIPDDILVISESAVRGREDARALKRLGLRGVLVGEALLKSDNLEAKMRELYDQD